MVFEMMQLACALRQFAFCGVFDGFGIRRPTVVVSTPVFQAPANIHTI